MRLLLVITTLFLSSQTAHAQVWPSAVADAAIRDVNARSNQFPLQDQTGRYEKTLFSVAKWAAQTGAAGDLRLEGRFIDRTSGIRWTANDKEDLAYLTVDTLEVFTITYDKWLPPSMNAETYFREMATKHVGQVSQEYWWPWSVFGVTTGWACYESDRFVVLAVAMGQLKDRLKVTLNNPTPYYAYAYDAVARKWYTLSPWDLRTVTLHTVDGGPAELYSRFTWENWAYAPNFLHGQEAFSLVNNNPYHRCYY